MKRKFYAVIQYVDHNKAMERRDTYLEAQNDLLSASDDDGFIGGMIRTYYDHKEVVQGG